MSAPVYRIKNWAEHFQKGGASQVTGPWRWVPIPVKHDGKGYRRLLRRDDGMQLFAAWILIVQVAAKAPERGLLTDGDGPLTALDIADKTGGDVDVIASALDVLSSADAGICWLEIVLTPQPGIGASMPLYTPLNTNRDVASTRQDNTSITRQDNTKTPPTPKGEVRNAKHPIEAEQAAWAERIYQAYPRHVGKDGALKAIRKAFAFIEPERLLALVEEYAACRAGPGCPAARRSPPPARPPLAGWRGGHGR